MSNITLSEEAFIKIDEIGAANWYPSGITNQPKKEVVATYKSDGAGGYYKEWPSSGTVLYSNSELLGMASYYDGNGDSTTADSLRIEISEVSMHSTRSTYEYRAGGGKSYYKQPPAANTTLITQGDTAETGRQECRLSVYPIGRYSPSIWRQFDATGELSPVYKEVFPPEGEVAWSRQDSEDDGDFALKIYIEEIDMYAPFWREFETTGSQENNQYIREKCLENGTVLFSAFPITESVSEADEVVVVLYDFFADGQCSYYKLPTPTTNTSTSGTSTSGVSGTETTETSGASGTDTTETSGGGGTGDEGAGGSGTGGGTGDEGAGGGAGDGTGDGTGGSAGGGSGGGAGGGGASGGGTGTTTTSGASGTNTRTIVSFSPNGAYVQSYDTDLPSIQYGTITWSDNTTSEGYTEIIGIYTYGPFAT